ncbi:hypothetical protein [Microbulbifer sp. ARAS458-1]|uniref:hypothetical protein n=1 Tax=Microbulbifer sp. ARAS458-1 TaxID=3140242 RepID=UPI003877C4F7
MAKNERTELPNRHTLYLAKSGLGKSQTLKRRGGLPKGGARVILWDNNRDHEAHREAKLSDFFRLLASAERSGKGYRVAYTGEPSPAIFEQWARGVWSILDGRVPHYLVIEEYSDCCAGPNPINPMRYPYHRRLWTQSRKYGGIIHATSQRPQLISKDALGNAGDIYASAMDSAAARRVAAEIDIDWRELRACQPGEFWYRNGSRDAEKMRVFKPKSQAN